MAIAKLHWNPALAHCANRCFSEKINELIAQVNICSPNGITLEGAFKYHEDFEEAFQASFPPAGESYLVGGHLYVCTGIHEPDKYYIDCGPVQGEPGEKGEQGPVGAQGPAGPQGPAGENGKDGSIKFEELTDEQRETLRGPQGATGPMGPEGPRGPQGEPGAEGAMGPQGPRGYTGETGPKGDAGPQGPEGPQGPAGVADPLAIYPVGSVYMSMNATSPRDIFGGTWQRIMNRFLFAAGYSMDSGETGGESEVTLDVSQIPEHTHNLSLVTPDGTVGKKSTSFIQYGYDGDNTTYTNANAIEKTGENQPHNNMPPYITVYMWFRTA